MVRLGEIYIVTGEFEKAIHLYESVFPHKGSRVEKAKIHYLICNAYFKMGDLQSCEHFADRGLGLLKERLPGNMANVMMSLIKELFIHVLHGVFPLLFVKRDRNDVDEKVSLIIDLYHTASWMYVLSDVKKFIYTILRMLNISESRIGISRQMGKSLAAYASMCMAIPFFTHAMKYHEKAIRLRKNISDEWGVGQSLQWLAYAYAWQGDYKESDEHFEKSLSIFRRIGDMWEIGMDLGGLSHNAYMVSDYDRCINITREYQSISAKLSDYYGISRCYQHYALCFLERGDHKAAEEYLSESHTLCVSNDLKFNLCFNYAAMGFLHIETGNYKKAIMYLKKAVQMERENNLLKYFIVFVYPLLAEAMLREFIEKKQTRLVVPKREIRKLQRHIAIALRKTRKWVSFHGCALRVQALFYSLTSDWKTAENTFLQSIELLKQCKRQFETAKTLMEYGLFLKRTGRVKEGNGKLEASCMIFMEIGSESYIRRISGLLNLHDDEGSSENEFDILHQYKLDVITGLSRDLGSISDLDEMLSCIMRKSLEMTGACRGYLFMKDNSQGEYKPKISVSISPDMEHDYSEHVLEMVDSNRQAVIITDAETDERLSHFESISRRGFKSILCVPLRFLDDTIGLCYLDNPLTKAVFTDEDKNIMTFFMSRASFALENANLYNNLEQKVVESTRELNVANSELENAYRSVSKAFDIIKEDLVMARKVHESILPRDVNTIEGLDIDLRFYPMSDVGGDIYDVEVLREGVTRFFIADATGHGVQAALITMAIMSEYNKIKDVVNDPADVLDRLNRVLFNLYSNINIIFSCVIADLYVSEGKMVFASAGHPTQYLIGRNGIIELERTGRIIGLFDASEYTSREYSLFVGDTVLLFTDGLYEHFDDDRTPYGEQRMKKIICGSKNIPVKQMVDEIIDDVESFLQYTKRVNDDDDVTVIGITVQ